MNKHALKQSLRNLYSRLLYHSGLCNLTNRLAAPRLTILAGHCVREEAVNGALPEDMKISGERLEAILRALAKHARPVTIGEGYEALQAGRERSLFALSMDDGYRDNLSSLVPLLERTGTKATVFLEARPLEERKVSWSHKYFWMLGSWDCESLARAYMAETSDTQVLEALRRVLEEGTGDDLAYRVKRVFKYESEATERNRVMDLLFERRGGDEAELCDRIYVTWQEAEALRDAGVEIGGHTVRHEVLATLEPDEVRQEIEQGRRTLTARLGEAAGRVFAYPFGRRWDFDGHAQSAVRSTGFDCAVTTHAGTNHKDADATRLARWMIDEETPIHLLVTEATGGFALLRRFGLELAE